MDKSDKSGKMKGLLIGLSAPDGEDEEDGEKGMSDESDDEGSLDAMSSLSTAITSGDAKGALEAFRKLMALED